MKKGAYEALSQKKNVIYGGEKTEEKILLLYMSEMGIYIHSFCGREENPQGVAILNKTIQSPREIGRKQSEYNVIVCDNNTEDNQSIRGQLAEYGIDSPLFSKDLGINSVRSAYKIDVINRILLESCQKKLIVYGRNPETRRFVQLLEMLDVNIAYFLEDDMERKTLKAEYDNNTCSYAIPIYSLYHILDEKKGDYRILTADTTYFPALEDMGLREGLDFADIEHDYRYCSRPKLLDPVLGYNWQADGSDIPGFVLYGNPKAKNKIAVLGGSTCDSMFDSYHSWPRFLYEKLINKYDVCIYSGGCEGYKSAQEMMKFVRDVIPLGPDIVLDYSGFNDAFCSETVDESLEENSFYNYFQIRLIKSISGMEKKAVKNHSLSTGKGYVLGNIPDEPRWEAYLRHNKIMHRLADAFGMSYYCFLQPCLITKKDCWGDEERQIYSCSPHGSEYFENTEKFYARMKKHFNAWFLDASHILDEYKDVYYDECHVKKRGNNIVADYMKSIIEKELR